MKRLIPIVCMFLLSCCAAPGEHYDEPFTIRVTYTDGTTDEFSYNKASSVSMNGGCVEVDYGEVACGVRSYKVIKR